MNAYDAWLYAAQWGSYMTSGDPGACMYGFDERFMMQSESHRQQCLDWIDNKCVPLVKAHQGISQETSDYDDDELDQLAELREAVITAPCYEESEE